MGYIDKCNKYIRKQELLGTKTFDFYLDEEKDEVRLMRYIPNNEDFRVVEIISFVKGNINIGNGLKMVRMPFEKVSQSLKIINKSQIMDMSFMFFRYGGNKLDLSEFGSQEIFSRCYGLEDIKVDDNLLKEEFDNWKKEQLEIESATRA